MPVLIWYRAGTWSFESLWSDLINANLSTCLATLGYWSHTHAPLSPYCLKENGDFISGPGLPLKTSMEIVWPSRLVSSGLGSNKSTELGAPSMKNQITDLALAGKCPPRGER